MSAQQQFGPHTTQEAKIAILVNELKKQQRLTANMQQQTTYLDKLFSKKKDLLKIINWPAGYIRFFKQGNPFRLGLLFCHFLKKGY